MTAVPLFDLLARRSHNGEADPSSHQESPTALTDLASMLAESAANDYQRIRSLEDELETLRNVRVAAADRAKATQMAVANALNSAADRIEKTTQVLNRTIGNGVAIG